MRNYDSRIRKIEYPHSTGQLHDMTFLAVMIAEHLGKDPTQERVMMSDAEIKSIFTELAKLQNVM